MRSETRRCCSSNPGAPALAVSPSSLSFSGTQGAASPAAKTIDIANTGAGSLDWTAADDAAWLSVSPSSGSGARSVTVTADTSGLAAGSYAANVTISASGATGSPRVVPVSLTVAPPPSAPGLGVAPASLSFTGTQGGANPAAKTLDVSNTGGGSLAWTVADDAPWLDVAPSSGTNAGTITVSPSISGLSAGTRTATVTVTAAGATGSPKTLPVTLTIDPPPPPPPALVVAPATLAFSATQDAAAVDTKAVNVANGGGGTLAFTASADVPWVTVTPTSGTAPRTVSVTPSTAGLAPGTWHLAPTPAP